MQREITLSRIFLCRRHSHTDFTETHDRSCSTIWSFKFSDPGKSWTSTALPVLLACYRKTRIWQRSSPSWSSPTGRSTGTRNVGETEDEWCCGAQKDPNLFWCPVEKIYKFISDQLTFICIAPNASRRLILWREIRARPCDFTDIISPRMRNTHVCLHLCRISSNLKPQKVLKTNLF